MKRLGYFKQYVIIGINYYKWREDDFLDINSIKKYIINSYSVIPTMEGFEKNSIIVVTAAGIIYGDVVLKNEEDNTVKLISKTTKIIVDNFKKEVGLEEEQSLPGNEGFFQLKNVSLLSNGVTTKLPILNIFYDQVIAFTVGSTEQE